MPAALSTAKRDCEDIMQPDGHSRLPAYYAQYSPGLRTAGPG
jgi:hypothetical protein